MSLFFSVMILYHKNRMATYFITPGYWHVISNAVHDSNALSVETLRQQHSKFTVQMRRLICAFVVRIWQKTGFLMTRLKCGLKQIVGKFLRF